MFSEDQAGRKFDEHLQQLPRERLLELMLASIASRFEFRAGQLRSAAEIADRSASEEPRSVRQARSSVRREDRPRIERAVNEFVLETKVSIDREVAEAASFDGGQLKVVLRHEVISLTPVLLLGEAEIERLSSVLDTAVTSLEGLRYAQELLGWRQSTEVENATLDALVCAAVTEYEDLLGALLRLGQMIHPNALGAGRKAISLDEIDERGGVELARYSLVDERARGILDRDPEGKRKALSDWPGVDPGEFVPSWDELAEVFHRRNALVHSSAQADEKYLRSTAGLGADFIGASLHCTLGYTLRAIDLLLASGLGLAAVWLPTLAGSGTYLHKSEELVIAMLSRQQWDLAESLSTAFLKYGLTGRDVHRVNNWMARREIRGDLEGLRDELEAWTPPDDDVTWAIARAALLEDGREVRTLLAGIPKSAHEAISRWPLIVRLRKKDRSLDAWLHQRHLGR